MTCDTRAQDLYPSMPAVKLTTRELVKEQIHCIYRSLPGFSEEGYIQFVYKLLTVSLRRCIHS